METWAVAVGNYRLNQLLTILNANNMLALAVVNISNISNAEKDPEGSFFQFSLLAIFSR